MNEVDGFFEKPGEKPRGTTLIVSKMFQLLPESDLKRYADKLGINIGKLKELLARAHHIFPVTRESQALCDELRKKAFEIYKKKHPEEFRRSNS
ncbi:MAG: hypothetical protein GH144_01030 [Clostridia bacterium]|nr:hypothetical protein [Clostridia bacterium]